MKTLLIFPPLWPPMAPYLAIPSLLAQLKKEGIKAEALDLNVEFYNDILKKSYLEETIKRIKKTENSTKNLVDNYVQKGTESNNYSIEKKELILKTIQFKIF